MDDAGLYRRMGRARALEVALEDLWRQGLVSGELHLGTGEEAVAAGVTASLMEGDALALDHRATPFMAARGLDLVPILRECLGREEGLCGGMGGHMHLLSQDDLVAASGIVGASGPAGAGFALAAKRLRPKTLAVATFGEGAINQGALLESLNLASAWKLPLVFVCKDNGWAITTESRSVTGGDIVERVQGFGVPAARVDGLDAWRTHEAMQNAAARAREGQGPSFILARCSRLDGHMLGDVLRRIASRPVSEGGETLGKITRELGSKGAGFGARAASLFAMTLKMHRVRHDQRGSKEDPLVRARAHLQDLGLDPSPIEADVAREIAQAVEAATQGVSHA